MHVGSARTSYPFPFTAAIRLSLLVRDGTIVSDLSQTDAQKSAPQTAAQQHVTGSPYNWSLEVGSNP